MKVDDWDWAEVFELLKDWAIMAAIIAGVLGVTAAVMWAGRDTDVTQLMGRVF